MLLVEDDDEIAEPLVKGLSREGFEVHRVATAAAALAAVLQPAPGQTPGFVLPDLGPENAVHLGAQLPMLVRGFYYEGWHMAGTPTKERLTEDLLEHVNCHVLRGLRLDPEHAVRAVFEVMCDRIDPGEIDKVIRVFPSELRSLWPESRHAPAARPGGGQGGYM